MSQVKLPTKKFTIAEYHQMITLGVLKEDENLELIKGEIIAMSPVGFKHSSCVNKLNYLLNLNLANQAIISVQNPIKLKDNSEPQPDLVLLKFSQDFYNLRLPQPEDILLVIEVADTSIEYDRNVKIPLYAENKISEVWLIDLNQKLVEVYQNPENNYYKIRQKLGNKDILNLIIDSKITVNIKDLF